MIYLNYINLLKIFICWTFEPIFDRIDENIDSYKYEVRRAHKELVEAEEDNRSSFVRKKLIYI